MKLKYLIIAFIALLSIPAFALTVSETSSVDYMRLNGYSDAVIDSAQSSKAAMNGEKYVTLDDRKHENDFCVVRWVRKFFNYVDPALDKNDLLHHDIKMVPSTNDL